MTPTLWRPGVVLDASKRTPAIDTAIKAALSPAQAMGITAWREAESRLVPGRGWVPNPLDAMVDILCVIDNRAKDPRWSKRGHKGACHQRWQFSCWERGGGLSNYDAVMHHAQLVLARRKIPSALETCIATAQAFIDGRHDDLLAGSTHYFATWMPQPPAWAFEDKARTRPRAFVCERYGHRFFNNVP